MSDRPKAIKMPKLSPTMETGIFGNWFVKVGDIVKAGQVIGEIETDKAIMEVESLEDGTIGYLADCAQKELPVNAVIGYILLKGQKAPESWDVLIAQDDPNLAKANTPTPQNTEAEKVAETKETTAKENILLLDQSRIYASPLAKKIASQKGIDLGQVVGTGPRGRIIKADLENMQSLGKQSKGTQTIQEGSYEIPLTPMRKAIAEKLTKSKQEIPHFYLEKKIYIGKLEETKNSLLHKFNLKVSLTPFLIKATALALKDNPVLNRTFENGKIIQHNHYSISIAIAVDEGLVVPVIANADKKGIKEIAEELADFASMAKASKLRLEHMQGGTFSISNLGMFGVDFFEAIINPPQVGILAVAGSNVDAVFEGGLFVPRKNIRFSLSCDHRVVDGADAAKFLLSLTGYIENPEGMMI